MRIMDGTVKKDTEVLLMSTGARYKVLEVGHLRPIGLEPCELLSAGEVGYFTASIKNVADTQVGDTVTEANRRASQGPPRLPARPAHGLLRHLHRGWLQISRPAGRAGQAQAERRLPVLRAGELRCSGIRLPLRLSGNAAYGDHSGAAGTGVRSGAGDDPALGHL